MEIIMPDLVRGCIAEFIGTFALVFVGCGSVVLCHDAPAVGGGAGTLLTVGLAHATVLVVFVGACLYISGSQFNPAVSVALVLAGLQSWTRASAFIGVQLAASACAAWLLVQLLGRASTDPVMLGATLGTLTLGEASDPIAAVVLEGLMTFALMFVIMAGLVDRRSPPHGGFYVGLTVLACILGLGPLTGASLNPARTFGPLLYHWGEHAPVAWVYLAGPLAGAASAVGVYRAVWAVPAEAS